MTFAVFSERSLYAIARPSVSVVCRLSSVTFVHPTQPVEIFAIFLRRWYFGGWPSVDIHGKFYGDCSSGTRGATTTEKAWVPTPGLLRPRPAIGRAGVGAGAGRTLLLWGFGVSPPEKF